MIKTSASSARARWATGSPRCSRSGFPRRASWTSRSRCSIAPAPSIEKSLGKFVEKGKLSTDDRDAALGRLSTTTTLDELSRRGLRRRSDRRGRRGQARAVHEPRRDRRAGRDPRVQHVVDLDHDARRGDEAAGQGARHALHEPGAADDAGRDDSRPGDIRRIDARSRRSCASRSARRRSKPRTIPASSRTAC